VPFHNHPRWQELQSEKKKMAEKIAEMEERLNSFESVPKKTETPATPSRSDSLIKKFEDWGMTPEAAKATVQDIIEAAKEQVAPIDQRTGVLVAEKRIDEFKRSPEGKNYDALEPEMTKIFKGFNSEVQRAVARDPNGIKMLYDLATLRSKESIAVEESKKKGSIRGTGGSSSASAGETKWTREKIKNLSDADFMKFQSEIAKAAARGEVS
jgi:polyhydroxyalkanoate synthesis regulator phasin